MSNDLMAVFTGVIALATVVYVAVTFFLWLATKRSADAAQLLAKAAKVAADMDAAVHRPYLGVSQLQRHNDFIQQMWAIRCCVKNYGTLPASHARASFVVDRDGKGDYGAGLLWTGCEIPPEAELEAFFSVGVDQRTRALISGGEPMVAHVEITYAAPGGARYIHKSHHPYDREKQNFRHDRSETRSGEA